MQETKYIWHNGSFIEWQEAKVHVLTHALHYGGGAFEGIRAYKGAKGGAIFRLKEHTDRLFFSSESIEMKIPFSKDEVSNAMLELMRRNELEECYLRPLVYFGYGKMGVTPTDVPTDITIATWPWGAYLPHDIVDLKITKIMRIHPSSGKMRAKLTGQYYNNIIAGQDIAGDKYHEALFLDYEGNIAEGPGENIYFVKNKELLTPSAGAILPGITRATLMELAKHLGYSVKECTITPEEAFSCDEAFFCGTAAEVTPIGSIDDNIFGGGKIGPITKELKELYANVVRAKVPEFEHFLTFV